MTDKLNRRVDYRGHVIEIRAELGPPVHPGRPWRFRRGVQTVYDVSRRGPDGSPILVLAGFEQGEPEREGLASRLKLRVDEMIATELVRPGMRRTGTSVPLTRRAPAR